jgi:hypothetical protein
VNRRAARVAAATAAFFSLASASAFGADERSALVQKWIAGSKPPASLRKQLDAASPLPSPPSVDLAKLVAGELSVAGRYRLHESAAPPQKSFLQVVWDWIVARMQWLWDRIFGRVHIGRGGAMAFGDVLIAISVLAIAFGAWRLIANFSFDLRRRATASQGLDEPEDAREAYRQAQAAAAAGDLARASRLLFRATVLALDLRGAVAFDSSATVGDLRRRLRSREGELVPPFDAIARPFVQSAYAEQPVQDAEWENASRAFSQILPDEATA